LKQFLWYQFPALAWIALIFLLSSFSTLPTLQIFSWQDKLEHAAAFFVLCLLARRAFLHQDALPRVRENAMLFAVMTASVYGVLDEIHQLYVPGRQFDYLDMAADAVGAGVCALAVYLLHRWNDAREAASADEY